MQKKILSAVAICPDAVQKAVQKLPAECLDRLEELRFRYGQEVSILLDGKEQIIPCGKVSKEWLEHILGNATGQAVYSSQETLKNGFVTIKGGHRLGICGRGIYKEGEVYTLREISSLNLRIARQIIGLGEESAGYLWTHPQSTLIIGPPGRGKTTLLRDIIRLLSDRFSNRISVADERMELAACQDGCPSFDLGRHTDILSGIKKAEAMELLLRAMNPQWIAVDEITAEEDVAAMLRASYCGVKFLATAHASCKAELEGRALYRQLIRSGVFQNLITILPNRTVTKEGLTTNA